MSENMRTMDAIIRGCLSVGKLLPWSNSISRSQPPSSFPNGDDRQDDQTESRFSRNNLIPNAISALSELSPDGLAPHMGGAFFQLRWRIRENSQDLNEIQIRLKSAEFMIQALGFVHEHAKTAGPKKRRKAMRHELIRFIGNLIALLASVFLLLFLLDHIPSGLLPDHHGIMYILPCLIVFGAGLAILADRSLSRIFKKSSVFQDAEIMSRALHESELVAEQLRILMDEGIIDKRLDDLIQRGEEICGLALQGISK